MTWFRRGLSAWAALVSVLLFNGGRPIVAGQQAAPPAPATGTATYVGSAACARCHAPIYDRWKKTRMANVVRDPREHPDAIIADFTKLPPPLTFTKDQVAFVYGSKWKQRYFTKVGDDYFPLPGQWDVTHAQWRAYNVAIGTPRLDWLRRFHCRGSKDASTIWRLTVVPCDYSSPPSATTPSRCSIQERIDT